MKSREKFVKYNIVTSLLYQFAMMTSGIIVPKLLISKFGSEVYGATTSITQFLGIVTLLEGGVGGVARAALYKPLANNDINAISAVFAEIKRFYKTIGYILAVYIVILACTFKSISGIEVLDWAATFFLVVAISSLTLVQYFIGSYNVVLIQATQKTYVSNILRLVTTVLNILTILFLINIGCDIIIVKFCSGLVFAIASVVQWIYVKKNFSLVKVPRQKGVLKDKWTGIGQNIADFIHSYTDVAVLTIFADLKLVAVYSVYSMVITAIQNIIASFATGMEALFGDMYAKNERDLLSKTFGEYETLLSCLALSLFSSTIVLITPFVKIYTVDITDANYIQPFFGILLTVASLLSCMLVPYRLLVIATGHLKQTRIAAYGEAFINVVISIILVNWLGIIGVAIGTICAVAFRFATYAFYVSKRILNRNIGLWFKRLGVNSALSVIIVLIGNIVTSKIPMTNYFYWAISAIIVAAISFTITICGNYLFYKEDTITTLRRLIKNKKGVKQS